MTTPTQELSKEVQPNILRPCTRAFVSRMHLFHFETTEAARSWLREVNARLYKISGDSVVWLNVSFTYPGLEKLGVDALDLAEFPQAFREGMARRAPLLGDPPRRSGIHLSDPTHAALNVLTQVDEALLAKLKSAGRAAQSPRAANDYDPAELRRALAQRLDDVCAGELAAITTGVGGERKLVCAHDLHHALVDQVPGDASSPPASVEYFGFRDGISQPPTLIDGQPNPQIVLPARGRRPGSLLANGTYLVARQLEQNVVELWKHMEENYQSAGLTSALELAELLVGRQRDGLPLGEAATGTELPRHSETAPPAFEHGVRDEEVAPRCPFQSHVRRMNPQLDPTRASAGTNPRLLRRGMSYLADDGKVGLMFMAYNADLERQFEFIQSNWVQKGNHAGGLTSHCDPLTSQLLADCAECMPGQPACDACLKGRGCQICHAGKPTATTTFVAARNGHAPLALKLPDFVTLKWGEYFFVPARSAIARMIDEAPALPRDEAEQTPDPSQLETVLGWINDSKLARTFWTKHVPEQGLRLGKHVFVKEPSLVRTVLSDPRPSHGLSVCEYGRKLRSISGPFVLGMDTDTDTYQREIETMAVIPTTYEDTRAIAGTARTAATEFLRLIDARALATGKPTQLEAGPLIVYTLSRVWGAHFGIPGPSRASLLLWAQEITDAVFRDGQTAIKMAQAEQAGKELRGYVLDLIVEARADERRKTHPVLLERLASFASNDDDDAARMLTGILVGGLTAVAGTFVPGLIRFAADQNGGDVAAALRSAPRDEGEGWPLYRTLARALEDDQVGGPDYLYRTYRGRTALLLETSAGAAHEAIEPGDTVISWIGGTALPDDGDKEIRFGAGAHLCPGREMARAIIDGTLAALGQCKTLVLADARSSKLELTLEVAPQERA